MPYCVTCQTEYAEALGKCPSCGAEVTDPGVAKDELVELANFPNASEAEMVQELMETNGIATSLRGEEDPIGATSGAEPVTLLVTAEDAERANELYEAYFAGEGGEPVEEEEQGTDQN
jgi:hypothetical protein